MNGQRLTKASWVLVVARIALAALTPPIVDVAGALPINLEQDLNGKENRYGFIAHVDVGREYVQKTIKSG